MMKPTILSVLMVLSLNLVCKGSQFAQSTAIVAPVHSSDQIATWIPVETDEMLVNPGKGWITTGLPTDKRNTPEVQSLCSGSYLRTSWAKLNPAEGHYDWTEVDRFIAAWKKLGKQSGLAVMPFSTHGGITIGGQAGYCTPKWVFDAGAAFKKVTFTKDRVEKDPNLGAVGDYIVPVFTDPVYKTKLKLFYAAMAERYDGHPWVSFIDVRVYGNWGEGHMYPLTRFWPAEFKEISLAEFDDLVSIQRSQFKKTPLLLLSGNFPKANPEGVGMRNDGIPYHDGRNLALVANRNPGFFEFYGSYDYMKSSGIWDGKKKWSDGVTLPTCVERGCPTWIRMPVDYNLSRFISEQSDLINIIGNRMGYHFVLTKAECPTTIVTGDKTSISMTWKNTGVAPVFIPCSLVFSLLDTNGVMIPGSVIKPEGMQPRSWLANSTLCQTTSVCWRGISAGSYQFAVGLVDPSNSSTPIIRIGIAGRTADGWYPLGLVMLRSPAGKHQDN